MTVAKTTVRQARPWALARANGRGSGEARPSRVRFLQRALSAGAEFGEHGTLGDDRYTGVALVGVMSRLTRPVHAARENAPFAMTRFCACLIAALLGLCMTAGAREPVRAQGRTLVAAAANLNFALNELVAEFERDRQATVDVVFGASGTLARQIEDGAPFQVFLAADEEFPARLAKRGLTRDVGVVYALGRLAIFAPAGSPLGVDARLDGLTRLVNSGGLTRFAIANPDVAPYGRAAAAVLRKRGLWNAIRPRLVFGDTVAQAAQFVTSGNAAGGLIAYSLVLAPGLANHGRYAEIPEDDHPPLRQRMVLMKRATPTAVQFYEYVLSDKARGILRKHGYGLP